MNQTTVKSKFVKPVVNSADTKVTNVVCKKANCSGASSHLAMKYNVVEKLVA